MKSTILDLVAVSAFTAFAAVVWWPACLLVIGLAAIAASWRINA